MRTFATVAAVGAASAALVGIQQTVALALQRAPGGTTTLITMGVALLGVWAIAALRDA
ncbi:MAG TPA: hypothetical protein VGN27_05440 [Gaiellaceae bacterium]|nr:hypothetical protein [Gaiellaceae bacterium]